MARWQKENGNRKDKCSGGSVMLLATDICDVGKSYAFEYCRACFIKRKKKKECRFLPSKPFSRPS